MEEPQNPDSRRQIGREAASVGETSEPVGVILEQYKLTVEMADRVSARRGIANSFFATLHTALVAVYIAVFVSPEGGLVEKMPGVLPVGAVGGVGVMLSLTWWLLLRSYRDLNNAKFAEIHDAEKRLPLTPFTDEWEALKSDRMAWWRPPYAELGTVERVIPFVFGGVYLAVMGWGLTL